MFFITRFSGKMPKWQSQTVKKEFNAFLFPNFSRIRTNRETGNFASVMEKQAFFFFYHHVFAPSCAKLSVGRS